MLHAIRHVVRHPVIVVGSSRTDSGVHAKGQIAHFDTDKTQIIPGDLRRAINHQLPEDILVRAVEPVPRDFDAIWSTVRKRYQYFIWHALDRPLFFCDLAWHRWLELDVDAIREAARYFVGEHDFTSFSRPGHGRESAIRTIHSLDITYRKPKLVIGVEGSGFLWHMVRIIVGTLVEVGLGRFRPEQMQEMLEAKDRRAAGPTAPPQGLYLQWIQTNEEKVHGVDRAAEEKRFMTPRPRRILRPRG